MESLDDIRKRVIDAVRKHEDDIARWRNVLTEEDPSFETSTQDTLKEYMDEYTQMKQETAKQEKKVCDARSLYLHYLQTGQSIEWIKIMSSLRKEKRILESMKEKTLDLEYKVRSMKSMKHQASIKRLMKVLALFKMRENEQNLQNARVTLQQIHDIEQNNRHTVSPENKGMRGLVFVDLTDTTPPLSSDSD